MYLFINFYFFYHFSFFPILILLFQFFASLELYLTLISVGSFVHLQRGHVSKWYIAFICPIIPHFSSILSQNYLKRKMTYLSTSKQQFLVFQKGIKRVWHHWKVLPCFYSITPEPLVIESRNSGFRFLFGYFLS